MLYKTTLREATLEDADAIANVYLTSRKKFIDFAPLIHTDENIYQWVRRTLIPSEKVIVAEENGMIIAMMALTNEKNIGKITQLYIIPEAVGRGVGTSLLKKAKEILGSPIQLYTFAQNIEARRFYERHGFEAIKFSDGSNNEEKCPDILYEWKINITKMHENELEINEQFAQSIIQQQCPQWANLPIIKINSSGTDNALFRLGIAYITDSQHQNFVNECYQLWLEFETKDNIIEILNLIQQSWPIHAVLGEWRLIKSVDKIDSPKLLEQQRLSNKLRYWINQEIL